MIVMRLQNSVSRLSLFVGMLRSGHMRVVRFVGSELRLGPAQAVEFRSCYAVVRCVRMEEM